MIKVLNNLNKAGTTLIEVLVYLAILISVAVSSVALLLSLDDLFGRYQVDTELYRSSTNVLEQVLLALRQAEQLDAANSVIEDMANGKLVVTSSATTTEFAKVGSALEMTINGDNKGNLLSDQVTVTGFTIYRHNNSRGILIRVKLDLSTTSGGVTKNITVYGGSVIRGDL